MAKERLDNLVVARGLAESREQAQRLIRAGLVILNGNIADKPGHKFPDDVELELKEQARFVGRGGDKLEAAFEAFDIEVAALDCIDVGASTGGFTDCMLQHGASRVIAVDVGRGQLHWKLRNDPRVVVMENVNARYLIGSDLAFLPSFATIDVSFISLTKVMPPVIQVLNGPSRMVTLIKPQFEAGRAQVGKGGVVRDPLIREETVDKIRRFGIDELGLELIGVHESPLKGPAGNVEFLGYWNKSE